MITAGTTAGTTARTTAAVRVDFLSSCHCIGRVGIMEETAGDAAVVAWEESLLCISSAFIWTGASSLIFPVFSAFQSRLAYHVECTFQELRHGDMETWRLVWRGNGRHEFDY